MPYAPPAARFRDHVLAGQGEGGLAEDTARTMQLPGTAGTGHGPVRADPSSKPDVEPRPAPMPAAQSRLGPELTIVVPTFNEHENVPLLVEKIGSVLAGVRWEVIFVDDDSPDRTAARAKALAGDDPRVRCIRRVGRRGLSGACIEGMLASAAPVVAVMDADLQHDEALLPGMLDAINEGAELVVGTRYAEGGTATAGFSAIRQWGSEAATWLARRLLGIRISDPMSGFFMIRREIVDGVAPKLSAQGFKILLDIIASSPRALATVELPYRFRHRLHGESKLDMLVTLEYLGLLLAKLGGDWLSVRFILFMLVGLSGLAVHLLALRAGLDALSLGFNWAQTFATYVAMTWNFVLNNQLTYRDRRLTGSRVIWGLLTFYAVCSVGAVANVGVASWIYLSQPSWWLAGTAGALMGAVFNYAASSALTWRQR